MNKFGSFLLALTLCEGAGIIGGLVTSEAVQSWYPTLTKPFFNPPPWIFGPVWTLLYLLMAIALYMIWTMKRKKNEATIRKQALTYFYIQLALNALWSLIFFGMRMLVPALIEIVIMWIFIFLTIRTFAKINKTASYFLYPYLAWVSFATILNASLAYLNP